MSPPVELIVLMTLAVLLTVVSILAGAFWWRARSVPLLRVAQLARELAERQRKLEELIDRFEKMARPRGLPGGPSIAGNPVRFDLAHTSAVPGPTLITIPDMAAPPAEPSAAASELEKRFGPIWELAERGESAEAIARSTGQPIGQVDLVLGLRRQLTAISERRP